MLGKKLSPILVEIENLIFDFEINDGSKPNYDIEAFRAASKIFMSALMDKAYELQDLEKMEFEDRMNMAQKAGEDLRALVKVYTNIDTHDLYK